MLFNRTVAPFFHVADVNSPEVLLKPADAIELVEACRRQRLAIHVLSGYQRKMVQRSPTLRCVQHEFLRDLKNSSHDRAIEILDSWTHRASWWVAVRPDVPRLERKIALQIPDKHSHDRVTQSGIRFTILSTHDSAWPGLLEAVTRYDQVDEEFCLVRLEGPVTSPEEWETMGTWASGIIIEVELLEELGSDLPDIPLLIGGHRWDGSLGSASRFIERVRSRWPDARAVISLSPGGWYHHELRKLLEKEKVYLRPHFADYHSLDLLFSICPGALGYLLMEDANTNPPLRIDDFERSLRRHFFCSGDSSLRRMEEAGQWCFWDR